MNQFFELLQSYLVLYSFKIRLSDLKLSELNAYSIFIAPEIFNDDEFDPRKVDIYSFVIVLYKMFTNEFSMPKKSRTVYNTFFFFFF